MSPARHWSAAASGYTLVELLVVLAIMGMLAAAAIPMLSASRPGLQAKAAARALALDLDAARQQAIGRGVVERVLLNPVAGRYATMPDGARRTLPKGISMAFKGAARNEIDFYPDGSASGGSVIVSGANARHRVDVSWPAGQIAIDE